MARATQQLETTQKQEIPGPPTWVSFRADTILDHNGRQVLGKFARHSDGSTRLEQWLTGDGSARSIQIHNVSAVESYNWTATTGWTSAPMQLPEAGWNPPRYRAGNTHLAAYKHKVAILKGQTGSLVADEGLEAYVQWNEFGDMSIVVPSLNFLDVVRTNAPTGRRMLYTNIEIQSLPASTFLPPPGVSVTHESEPRGIVRVSPGEMAPVPKVHQ